MATTVAAFSAIDDTEVDADSPITESLVTRIRDNSYWIIAGTNKTTETTQGVYLRTADTAGTLEWAAAGVDGTKGSISTTTLGTTWQTLTTLQSGILNFNYSSRLGDQILHGGIIVDLSDDTFVAQYGWTYDNSGSGGTAGSSGLSGTITTGQLVGAVCGVVGNQDNLNFRRNGTTLEYQASTTNRTLRASWVIL